jgi:cytochrome c oxidase assembly protein subunit 15
VFVQIYLGALVAGLDAGLVFNTWPLMEGRLIPPASDLLAIEPAWRNLFENRLTVQFGHRMVAYGLFVLAVLHALDVRRTLRSGPALMGATVLAGAICLQAGIGILTLLHTVPMALALLHQGMAVVVLVIAVGHAERMTAGTSVQAVAAPHIPSLERTA